MTLTVHGIGELGRPLDDGEEETTLRTAEFDAALDVIEDLPWVRLTFDDGNASDALVALPRLVERGMTATFFVLAGKFGQPGFLDREGVAELAAAGMSIGSHGWAHRSWRGMSVADCEQELVEAPRAISEIVGRPVTEVAIPFGQYDREVLTRLRAAGTTRAHTSDGGPCREGSWLQPRTSLRRGLTSDSVRAVVEGHEGRRTQATRVAKRLVKRVR